MIPNKDWLADVPSTVSLWLDRPDFLIISPPKTGSTWLATNLASHSKVFLSPVKEVKYFSNYYQWLGLWWYLGHFQQGADKHRGEATPSYAILPVETITSIRGHFPGLKLIMLLREPIGRAWSHAKHCFRYREANFERHTGDIESVPESMWRSNFTHDWTLASGDYLGQLRRWLTVFGPERIYVGFFESIIREPLKLFRDTLAFLEVEHDVAQTGFHLEKHAMRGAPMELPHALEPYLHSIWHERTLELEAFLKKQFDLSLPAEWQESLRRALGQPQASELSEVLDRAAAVFAKEFNDPFLTSVLTLDPLNEVRTVMNGYNGYQIVTYRRSFYALALTLGHVDLHSASANWLRARELCGECLIGDSLSEIQQKVDRIQAS